MRRRCAEGLGVAGLAMWTVLFSVGVSSAAQPAFEPNDTPLTATGPLVINSSYEAGLETSNDIDYYFFYVTAPSTAQVQIAITNLSPPHTGYFESRIENSDGGGTGNVYETSGNETDTNSVTLKPGKYLFKVSGGQTGLNYSFKTSGTDGAFGPFTTISANCASAMTNVNTAQEAVAGAKAAVAKALSRWKRALAHMHRVERRGSLRAKRQARHKAGKAYSALKRSKAALKETETAYKATLKLEHPWCFIPQ